MNDSANPGALDVSETQIRDAIWERIGNRGIDELSDRLGFDPEVKTMGTNRITFEDSGHEVTMWLNGAMKVSMVSVRRLDDR
jgi:hypothetical protein